MVIGMGSGWLPAGAYAADADPVESVKTVESAAESLQQAQQPSPADAWVAFQIQVDECIKKVPMEDKKDAKQPEVTITKGPDGKKLIETTKFPGGNTVVIMFGPDGKPLGGVVYDKNGKPLATIRELPDGTKIITPYDKDGKPKEPITIKPK